MSQVPELLPAIGQGGRPLLDDQGRRLCVKTRPPAPPPLAPPDETVVASERYGDELAHGSDRTDLTGGDTEYVEVASGVPSPLVPC